jgi:hypothetical protein
MHSGSFDDDVLSILLRAQSWRLVSALGADCRPVESARHLRWTANHRHAHTYPEIMIALAGETVYGIDRRIYPCVPGSVFVFHAHTPHDEGYPPWMPTVTHLWIALLQDSAMARLVVGDGRRLRTQANINSCAPCRPRCCGSRARPQTPQGSNGLN